LRFALALVVVGLTGFISLSYEILWYRAYSFVSGGAPATFGLLLGSFLLGLALGAFVGQLFCRERAATRSQSQLRRLGAFLVLADIAGFLVVPTLAAVATRSHWVLTLPLVGVAAGLFGATLPLLSHFGIAPDVLVGARLSYLYLANIIGSATGSFLTGFLLLDVMSLREIALLLALTGLGLSVPLLFAGPLTVQRALKALAFLGGSGLVIAGVTPIAYHRLYERLLYKDHYSEGHWFEDTVETRSGVVTVSRWGAVFGGGAYDGRISTSLTDDRNATVRAYAVAAVHPRPRRVLMVGLATGAWAHVLAQMPGVESLTVVEIDPGYLRLIAKYPEVSGLLSNPRVRIVIDDGRRWLSRHPGETFDVIVMNTTWHWRAHVTNLLSYEYLQLVRRHLRPGGIYHFNTTSSEDAIYTAFTTFPFGVRFRSMATVSDSPISVDGERWRRVLSEYTLDGRPVFDLTRPEGRAQLDRIVALTQTLNTPSSRQSAFEWRESVLARLEGARLITDDNMAPEWQRLFEYVWIPRDER
jgi:spermidine synthase